MEKYGEGIKANRMKEILTKVKETSGFTHPIVNIENKDKINFFSLTNTVDNREPILDKNYDDKKEFNNLEEVAALDQLIKDDFKAIDRTSTKIDNNNPFANMAVPFKQKIGTNIIKQTELKTQIKTTMDSYSFLEKFDIKEVEDSTKMKKYFFLVDETLTDKIWVETLKSYSGISKEVCKILMNNFKEDEMILKFSLDGLKIKTRKLLSVGTNCEHLDIVIPPVFDVAKKKIANQIEMNKWKENVIEGLNIKIDLGKGIFEKMNDDDKKRVASEKELVSYTYDYVDYNEKNDVVFELKLQKYQYCDLFQIDITEDQYKKIKSKQIIANDPNNPNVEIILNFKSDLQNFVSADEMYFKTETEQYGKLVKEVLKGINPYNNAFLKQLQVCAVDNKNEIIKDLIKIDTTSSWGKKNLKILSDSHNYVKQKINSFFSVLKSIHDLAVKYSYQKYRKLIERIGKYNIIVPWGKNKHVNPNLLNKIWGTEIVEVANNVISIGKDIDMNKNSNKISAEMLGMMHKLLSYVKNFKHLDTENLYYIENTDVLYESMVKEYEIFNQEKFELEKLETQNKISSIILESKKNLETNKENLSNIINGLQGINISEKMKEIYEDMEKIFNAVTKITFKNSLFFYNEQKIANFLAEKCVYDTGNDLKFVSDKLILKLINDVINDNYEESGKKPIFYINGTVLIGNNEDFKTIAEPKITKDKNLLDECNRYNDWVQYNEQFLGYLALYFFSKTYEYKVALKTIEYIYRYLREYSIGKTSILIGFKEEDFVAKFKIFTSKMSLNKNFVDISIELFNSLKIGESLSIIFDHMRNSLNTYNNSEGWDKKPFLAVALLFENNFFGSIISKLQSPEINFDVRMAKTGMTEKQVVDLAKIIENPNFITQVEKNYTYENLKNRIDETTDLKKYDLDKIIKNVRDKYSIGKEPEQNLLNVVPIKDKLKDVMDNIGNYADLGDETKMAVEILNKESIIINNYKNMISKAMKELRQYSLRSPQTNDFLNRIQNNSVVKMLETAIIQVSVSLAAINNVGELLDLVDQTSDERVKELIEGVKKYALRIMTNSVDYFKQIIDRGSSFIEKFVLDFVKLLNTSNVQLSEYIDLAILFALWSRFKSSLIEYHTIENFEMGNDPWAGMFRVYSKSLKMGKSTIDENKIKADLANYWDDATGQYNTGWIELADAAYQELWNALIFVSNDVLIDIAGIDVKKVTSVNASIGGNTKVSVKNINMSNENEFRNLIKDFVKKKQQNKNQQQKNNYPQQNINIPQQNMNLPLIENEIILDNVNNLKHLKKSASTNPNKAQIDKLKSAQAQNMKPLNQNALMQGFLPNYSSSNIII